MISMFAPAIMMNDTATPTNTRRSALVASATCEMPSTKTVAPSSPKKAKSGTVSRPMNNPVCKSANIAQKASSEDIPKRYGSAKGLRVTA